jgi:hypothetical protein
MKIRAKVFIALQKKYLLSDRDVAIKGGFDFKLASRLRNRGDQPVRPSTLMKVIKGFGLTYQEAEKIGLIIR